MNDPRDLADLTGPERKRLASIADRLASLDADAWDPPPPPPLRSLPAPESPVRRRGLVLRPAFAAAACVGLLAAGLGGGIALERSHGGNATVAGRTQVLERVGIAPPAAGGTIRLTDEASPRITVDVHGAAPSGTGRYYEVWLMNSATDLVSLGGFRVDDKGVGTFDAPLPLATSGFKLIDISLEPSDGNPGHSADSVLRTSL